MNKIERRRVKHARAKLNAKIDHLAAQLKTAQEQLRLARHDRAIAESTLEDWRKKLQAIHHHIAILNPDYKPNYHGPQYPEPVDIATWDDSLPERSLSRRVLTMAELYLEMTSAPAKYARYFHFTAHTPKGTTRRLAYCVSEPMWKLMSTGFVGEEAFLKDIITTMYKKVLQITD